MKMLIYEDRISRVFSDLANTNLIRGWKRRRRHVKIKKGKDVICIKRRA